MKNNKRVKRRHFLLGTTAIATSSSLWLKPTINTVFTPVHAQTSVSPLCQDGTSTWLMSDHVENGVTFSQGSPQSQVQIVVSGSTITMTTDWFVINNNTSAVSRGRVIDQGTINLSSGAISTAPIGSPSTSPTHGGVINLVNNLPQSFTANCSTSSDLLISDNSGIYSFRLTRIS